LENPIQFGVHWRTTERRRSTHSEPLMSHRHQQPARIMACRAGEVEVLGFHKRKAPVLRRVLHHLGRTVQQYAILTFAHREDGAPEVMGRPAHPAAVLLVSHGGHKSAVHCTALRHHEDGVLRGVRGPAHSHQWKRYAFLTPRSNVDRPVRRHQYHGKACPNPSSTMDGPAQSQQYHGKACPTPAVPWKRLPNPSNTMERPAEPQQYH
jgi:hypothetical protein